MRFQYLDVFNVLDFVCLSVSVGGPTSVKSPVSGKIVIDLSFIVGPC